MPKSISISLSHSLQPEELKQRIIRAIADARAKNPDLLKDAREQWTENQMDFSAQAMGQAITGRIVIEPTTVNLTLELPVMLAMLASSLKPQIEARGRKLLEN